MDSNKSGGKSWLWGLGALALCLPCVLPVLIVAFLAAGGAGAVGSFVSGTGGVLALLVGALLLALAAAVYVRWRLKRGASLIPSLARPSEAIDRRE